jgi:uncharacterized alkaline shock family protein YloU
MEKSLSIVYRPSSVSSSDKQGRDAMSSRRRKDNSGFGLQSAKASANGKKPLKKSAEDAAPVGGTPENAAQGDQIGKIEVSSKAIAHLASRAAQRSYGVVGLAPRHSRPGWAELLRLEEAHKGVEVKFPDERVLIELYVVIEYGTRISEVARNIMSNVKFAVESALDVSVVQVNVNVQDIRVSDA